jgi:hypothetical protein
MNLSYRCTWCILFDVQTEEKKEEKEKRSGDGRMCEKSKINRHIFK